MGLNSVSIVTAVVVTYEPRKAELLDLLQAIVPQVAKIIVVDNASVVSVPIEWSLCSKFPTLEMHCHASNDGIAVAQNQGIAIALGTDTTHILFCDQDSTPTHNLVAKLLEGLILASNQIGAMPVAAISPATVDSRTRHVSTFIPSDKRSAKVKPASCRDESMPMMDAGFLISSGMLIPVEIFAVVGGLRSEYFIDHVDTEWCFRARAAGYRLVGLELPLLRHSLGDEVQKVWLFRERHVSTHAPLRDYYMARNTLAMIRGGDLSFAWCMHFLWRIVQFFGFYMLLSNNKRQHLKMLYLGLAHGLRGISGKLNVQTLQTEPVPR
ncbi:MAG: glycosyltransferase family 2 protein, partial [Methylococcales bacterium]